MNVSRTRKGFENAQIIYALQILMFSSNFVDSGDSMLLGVTSLLASYVLLAHHCSKGELLRSLFVRCLFVRHGIVMKLHTCIRLGLYLPAGPK